MTSYKAELEVATRIAYKAGDIMQMYFRDGQERIIKDDGTPLTIADTTINRMVIDELTKHFPEDLVIGEEESTGGYGLGRRWLCDPIDGTKAFTWGVPTAMFSLALVIDGTPTVGAAYEPQLDALYTAVTGEGAFCNGQPLSVNNDSLASGILATVSSPGRIRNQAAYLGELIDSKVDMATFSGAVAKSVRVAEGRFVGYLEEMVSPYDMAAVDVIVTEAGGKLTDFNGELLDYINGFKGAVVSNGAIHNELLQVIARSRMQP